MITLTRAELEWLLRMVQTNRDRNRCLMGRKGIHHYAWHERDYKILAGIAVKLTMALETNAKRIAVGDGS